MALDELQVVNEAESKEIPIEELVKIWRANHRIILNYLLSADLPYFGLHGAPKKSIEGILRDRKAHLQLGTFYDKDKSELRAYQLYDLCSYVAAYCRERYEGHETEGGILVFNLEGNHGENITSEWEHLYSQGFLTLSLDTEEEIKMLRNFYPDKIMHNSLWRTTKTFKSDFETRFKGVVARSDLTRTESEVERTIALARLDNQYNLAKVFDVLRQYQS